MPLFFRQALRLWESFWTDPVDLLKLSFFRLLLGATGFLMYALRHTEWELYFTNEGPIPYGKALDLVPEFYRPAFLLLPEASFWVGLLHGLFVVLLLLLTVGIGGRVTSIFCFILHMAFLHRNFAMAYGADYIFGFWLLYLSLSSHSEYLSLRLFSFQGQGVTRFRHDIASRVGCRFIQIQLCVIYAFSGFEKLRGHTWWQGEALWEVLANSQASLFDLSFMARFPLLLFLLGWGVILFEIYFGVLIWIKQLRPTMLVLGMSLHFFIATIMGLPFFAVLMVLPYLLFFDDKAVWFMAEKLRSLWPSPKPL